MRLSDAIRKGADWPDCHGPLFGTFDDPPGSCCAIGGVIMAVGGDRKSSFKLIAKECPLLYQFVDGPTSPGSRDTFFGVIVRLFEFRYMSKKAIAEWVETEERRLGIYDEPQELPAKEPEPEAVQRVQTV